jgi:hypothetical protein
MDSQHSLRHLIRRTLLEINGVGLPSAQDAANEFISALSSDVEHDEEKSDASARLVDELGIDADSQCRVYVRRRLTRTKKGSDLVDIEQSLLDDIQQIMVDSLGYAERRTSPGFGRYTRGRPGRGKAIVAGVGPHRHDGPHSRYAVLEVAFVRE